MEKRIEKLTKKQKKEVDKLLKKEQAMREAIEHLAEIASKYKHKVWERIREYTGIEKDGIEKDGTYRYNQETGEIFEE